MNCRQLYGSSLLQDMINNIEWLIKYIYFFLYLYVFHMVYMVLW
jgi:hypothetical protein